MGKNRFTDVMEAEIGSPVAEYSHYRWREALVKSRDAALAILGRNHRHQGLLARLVHGERVSRIVQRVHSTKACSSGHTAGHQVSCKELREILLLGTSNKQLFVLLFEHKIERLSWKVTNEVGAVSSPEGNRSFFRRDSLETIDHSA